MTKDAERRKEAHKLILKGLNAYFDDGPPVTIPFIEGRISLEDFPERISRKNCDDGAVAFIILNNLAGGSAMGKFDLYQLLQSYILNPDLRKKIDKTIYDYHKDRREEQHERDK